MNIECPARLVKLLPSVFICLIVLLGCTTQHTRFTAAGNDLSGELTLPENADGPVPVAIFVHGDGPANANYYGYYRPFKQILADRGIASFSWDKPGVGNSNGNWLDQNMSDRAEEVVAAAMHLARRPEIDAEHIGVIGFSQAGWVLPRLANEAWLDYLVFISTAVNWTRQGDYLLQSRWALRATSDPDGYRDAIEQDQRFGALLRDDDASYADYIDLKRRLDESDSGKPMSPDRFEFAKRNMHEDASQNLKNIRVPVLALFGNDDLNVDVENSRSLYSAIFNRSPAIDYSARLFPGATHQLTKSHLFNQQTPGWWAGLVINVLQDDVFVDGVLTELADFVSRQRKNHEH